MLCAIWYHLYNLQKCKKHAWMGDTFSKVAGYNPPWVFFTFKLYKWYQIAQSITYEKSQISKKLQK